MADRDEVEFPLFDEVHVIVACAMAVYNNLGYGFLESVYQEALERELARKGVLFERQKHLVIYYQGEALSKTYVADLVCWGKVIVELKAKDKLSSADGRQVVNYLKATGCEVGLVVNFGSRRRLEWERYVFSDATYLRRGNVPLAESDSRRL